VTPLARRIAWFCLDCALDSGFVLKADGDALDISPPPDMPDEVREPIVTALLEHRPQVIDFLKFLDAEACRGRHWRPGARGTAQ
jgi:hypothetical protein